VPPAIFPVVLGLMGLGLAWRTAALQLGWPAAPGETILGASSGLLLFAVLAYAVKLARRPKVLAEDLAVLPGQAGLAAQCLALYLLAAALAPYGPALALAVLTGALVWHVMVAALTVGVLVTGPAERRRVSPVWHLSFVGFIVAALVAQQLAVPALSEIVLILTFVLACAIWGASLEQARKSRLPAPLRPLLAIHLAPAALIGQVALGFDLVTLANGQAGLCVAIMLFLLVRLRWLTEAGFSPFWGALTFPLAATAALWIGLGGLWSGPGLAALLLASVAVPVIAWRILRLWARGNLAAITNAAVA
jgi:tellurite resistance protein